MAKFTILCHPCTPVPEANLEAWLEEKVDQLRKAAPDGIIRMSRLAQELPDTEIGIGWLIELEMSEESIDLRRNGLADALADVVTDMRFLGLQPRVLSPHELSGRDGDRPAPRSDSAPVLSAPVLDYPGLR